MTQNIRRKVRQSIRKHQTPYAGTQLKTLEMTCSACPSQWDAHTKDGTYVYIRYRWGVLSVSWCGVQSSDPRNWSVTAGDPFDGTMSTERMLQLTGFIEPKR